MSWTLLIIILNVVFSYRGFQDPALQYRMTMNPVAILRYGQWYRVITSGFIHSNWGHLLFNMFTLYFFGQLVEYTFIGLKGGIGGIWYVCFYLLGIVISDLPSLIKHKDHPHYNSLGASGGVSAVVFSSILFYPTNDICLYGFICFPGFLLGALYLIYSYTKGKQMSDNINHDAHLFGAVFGLLFSVVLEPNVLVGFFRQMVDYLSTF